MTVVCHHALQNDNMSMSLETSVPYKELEHPSTDLLYFIFYVTPLDPCSLTPGEMLQFVLQGTNSEFQ